MVQILERVEVVEHDAAFACLVIEIELCKLTVEIRGAHAPRALGSVAVFVTPRR